MFLNLFYGTELLTDNLMTDNPKDRLYVKRATKRQYIWSPWDHGHTDEHWPNLIPHLFVFPKMKEVR